MKKTLQNNSKYNDYDLDGDGIVTDEELENAKAIGNGNFVKEAVSAASYG